MSGAHASYTNTWHELNLYLYNSIYTYIHIQNAHYGSAFPNPHHTHPVVWYYYTPPPTTTPTPTPTPTATATATAMATATTSSDYYFWYA